MPDISVERILSRPAAIGEVWAEGARPAAWRKSTFCNGASTCVEVAPLPDGGVAVRDSKDPDGAAHRFTAEEWAAFVAGVRAGEFDLANLQSRSVAPDADARTRAATGSQSAFGAVQVSR